MYQLRNLIGRSNVPTDPTKKYNECDDFFKLVIRCHVLVAAFKYLNMESLSDIPTISGVNNPQELWMALAPQRNTVLREIGEGIFDKFASFQFNGPPAQSQDKVCLSCCLISAIKHCVCEYMCVSMTIILFLCFFFIGV